MKYRFLNCQPVKVSYILFRVLVYEILVGVPMIGGLLVLSSMKQHDVIKKRIQFQVKWQIVIWVIYIGACMKPSLICFSCYLLCVFKILFPNDNRSNNFLVPSLIIQNYKFYTFIS